MGVWRRRWDCARMMTATLFQVANVAQAVEVTITTPTPGVGHGRVGDIAAALTCLAGFLGAI
jgi:hypothetical protein